MKNIGTSFSIYQQLRQRLLWSMLGVLVLITFIGSFSYWKNFQEYIQLEKRQLQAFVTLHQPNLQSQWPTILSQPLAQQKAWLHQLRLPNSQIQLWHQNQRLLQVPSASPLPHSTANNASFPFNQMETTLTHTLPLDDAYQIRLQEHIHYPITYLQFMTRPFLAITFTGLIIWFFLGRWAKQKQRELALLQQAITAYQNEETTQARRALTTLVNQQPSKTDEIRLIAKTFLDLFSHLQTLLAKNQHINETLTLLEEIVITLNHHHQVLENNITWQKLQQQLRCDSASFLDTLYPEDIETWKRQLQQALDNHLPEFSLHLRLKSPNNAPPFKWYEGRFIIHYKEAAITLIGVLRDIHEQKLKADHAQRLALHDALTSLPNRLLLSDRIQQTIEHAKRRHQPFALLFFDLDHFKEINDTLGHQAGDDLLKQVTQRISRMLRKEDTLARWAGDEFVMLIPHAPQCEMTAKTIAQKLVNHFKDPFILQGHPVTVTCSVGIACYPHHGETEKSLLEHADEAMYQAKQAGRNRYHLYQTSMDKSE